MTELEKRAARMKWDPPATGTEERKEMPKTAFLSESTRTFPYKVKIDGQWVTSEKGLRSAISVANFRGNTMISSRASKLLEELLSDEVKHADKNSNSLKEFLKSTKFTRFVRTKIKNIKAPSRLVIKFVSDMGERII